MVKAAEIFNPMLLKGTSNTEIVTHLHILADKLNYFNYPQFMQDFIKHFKKEIPKVVQEANRDSDLDRITSSQRYQTWMQRRIKRKKLEWGVELDWKKDDGEYASRIWKWWRPRVHNFPFFALALRLVALTQLSSCSGERVFSRLKYIRDACGDNMKEDNSKLTVDCCVTMQRWLGRASRARKYNH
jgi:hypothetical protein